MDITVTYWFDSAPFPLLSSLTLAPLLTLAAVLYTKSSALAYRFAYAGATLGLGLSIYLLFIFDAQNHAIRFYEHLNFLGMSYSVGVDGSNILFIPLTALLSLLALVYLSNTRNANDRTMLACIMGYETILMGAFLALNVLQFWFWTALELVPVILLTVHSGTGNRRRQIISRFLHYWASGLLMTLAGFMLLAFGLIDSEHPLTFDWITLKQSNTYLNDEVLIFILLFFGFSIRMPLFPFHGWLPILAEHGTVASTSIFLVGLKLGVYGVIRFILPIVPGVAEQWNVFVLTLGLISIFYGALLALMQINIRRLLSFAVVSHTGMLVIGLFCFNEYGLEGSLLLCVAYGLATAGMLFSVGLVYDRTRTAFTPRLGGLFDTNVTIALLFFISALSTMAMPLTPGFDAAHMLIEGAVKEHEWLLAVAILLGNVLSAGFLLRAFQQTFIAQSRRAHQPYSSIHHPVSKERMITLVICTLLMGTGFYSTPWLNFIDQAASGLAADFPMHSAPQISTDPDTVNDKDDPNE